MLDYKPAQQVFLFPKISQVYVLMDNLPVEYQLHNNGHQEASESLCQVIYLSQIVWFSLSTVSISIVLIHFLYRVNTWLKKNSSTTIGQTKTLVYAASICICAFTLYSGWVFGYSVWVYVVLCPHSPHMTEHPTYIQLEKISFAILNTFVCLSFFSLFWCYLLRLRYTFKRTALHLSKKKYYFYIILCIVDMLFYAYIIIIVYINNDIYPRYNGQAQGTTVNASYNSDLDLLHNIFICAGAPLLYILIAGGTSYEFSIKLLRLGAMHRNYRASNKLNWNNLHHSPFASARNSFNISFSRNPGSIRSANSNSNRNGNGNGNERGQERYHEYNKSTSNHSLANFVHKDKHNNMTKQRHSTSTTISAIDENLPLQAAQILHVHSVEKQMDIEIEDEDEEDENDNEEKHVNKNKNENEARMPPISEDMSVHDLMALAIDPTGQHSIDTQIDSPKNNENNENNDNKDNNDNKNDNKDDNEDDDSDDYENKKNEETIRKETFENERRYTNDSQAMSPPPPISHDRSANSESTNFLTVTPKLKSPAISVTSVSENNSENMNNGNNELNLQNGRFARLSTHSMNSASINDDNINFQISNAINSSPATKNLGFLSPNSTTSGIDTDTEMGRLSFLSVVSGVELESRDIKMVKQVTKQNVLVLMGMILSMLHYIFALIGLFVNSEIIALIDIFLCAFGSVVIVISLPLSFKFYTKEYEKYCLRCHKCCWSCCVFMAKYQIIKNVDFELQIFPTNTDGENENNHNNKHNNNNNNNINNINSKQNKNNNNSYNHNNNFNNNNNNTNNSNSMNQEKPQTIPSYGKRESSKFTSLTVSFVPVNAVRQVSDDYHLMTDN